ncbi:hypothetical protein BT96DRAFT_957455 [Gymnopus androsaceus JB14]|uniref:Uncharacterized protein n=1 Tax=Gymnopus androsaceus JB14 TaxID=1447944 RepID=A0A6A4HK29_9AGAR|nr:hypothetical protein BT96DRAFT_957455 [Gymnopus androsaceus JB14]
MANGKEKQGESNGSAGMYRPKARPRDEDLEDESEDDPEQALQISQSAAHEKLAAFADRRTAKASAAPGAKVGSSSRAPPPPVLPLYANPVQVPLPLGFPYNLPPAAPPSTPRTTRRVMLQKEMPEELLHNLLWSRRVLKQELAGPRRASSSALSPGLRPLTALPTNPVVQLTEKKKRPDGEPESKANTDDEDDLLEADQILRPAKMTRNRSWAGGGR